MIHLVLSLRWITLVAALGAAIGAVLMFGVGCAKLAHAVGFAPLAGEPGGLSVVALVMLATDAFLFGLVLVVFAYAIAFGFAFDLSEGARAKLPKWWMRIDGIAEIKITLIEVILVYLVVDFVTDVVEAETPVSWDMLVKPVAILLIAGALRLIETKRSGVHPGVPERPGRPANITRLLSGE
jgi:uncharacterized membrane protein YqhA